MSNRRAPKKTSGLRAALAARKTRIERYGVPLVESHVADEAAAAFSRHSERLVFATFSGDADLADSVRGEAERAKADLEKCFYWIRFQGLPEADFDALVNEHPPTDEQRARGEKWNPETFPYALLVACILDDDSGMDADEWKAELGSPRWTRSDRVALLRTVYDANQREFSHGIPKG